jgi:hypothetical protein
MSNVTATTTLLDLYLEGFKTKSNTNQLIAAARAVGLGELIGKNYTEKKLLQFLLGYSILLVNRISNVEDTYTAVKKLQILGRIKTEYIDVLDEHVDEAKNKRALGLMHSYLKAETGVETLTAHIEQLLAVYDVPSKYYGFIVTVGLSTLRNLSNPLTHSKTMDQINQLRKLMNTEEEEVKEETLNKDEDLMKETQQERSKFDIEEDLKSIDSPIGKLLDKYNVPEKYQSLIERTIEGLFEKAVEYIVKENKKGRFDNIKASLPEDVQEELKLLTSKLEGNLKDNQEIDEDDEEKEELEDDGQPVRLLSPNERHKLQVLFAQNPHKMDDRAYRTLYTATNKDYPRLLKKYAA